MPDKKLRRLPLAAAALVVCVSAQAEYQSPDGNLRLSGFGTIGVARSSTNDVLFNYLGQGGGAGTTPSFDPDSKLALQGNYKVSPTLSLTTQIMTKYDAFASYEPKVDWAFVKWQATPALTLRGGRMGLPVFMVSDFRDVGYANTPVRPPLDTYAQVPVSQFNGADASYQLPVGSTTYNASVHFGNAKADYAATRRLFGAPFPASEFKLDGLHSLNLSAEMDNGVTLHVGKFNAKMSVTAASINDLVEGTTPFRSSFPQYYNHVMDNVIADGSKVTFTDFGASYDQDNWVISAEYTHRRSAKYVSSTKGWYTNVGYRVGQFTPYVGLSRLAVDDPRKLDPAGTGLLAVDQGVQYLLDTQKLTQRTTTLGLRWDVMPSTALKVQWDHVTKPKNSCGLFFTEDPGESKAQSFLQSSRRVNILSLSMDFLF